MTELDDSGRAAELDGMLRYIEELVAAEAAAEPAERPALAGLRGLLRVDAYETDPRIGGLDRVVADLSAAVHDEHHPEAVLWHYARGVAHRHLGFMHESPQEFRHAIGGMVAALACPPHPDLAHDMVAVEVAELHWQLYLDADIPDGAPVGPLVAELDRITLTGDDPVLHGCCRCCADRRDWPGTNPTATVGTSTRRSICSHRWCCTCRPRSAGSPRRRTSWSAPTRPGMSGSATRPTWTGRSTSRPRRRCAPTTTTRSGRCCGRCRATGCSCAGAPGRNPPTWTPRSAACTKPSRTSTRRPTRRPGWVTSTRPAPGCAPTRPTGATAPPGTVAPRSWPRVRHSWSCASCG